jgi:general stress protein YciG
LTDAFYTYLWLREDGTPYYVGKGRGRRAFISRAHTVRRPKELSRIIVQEFETEEDAFRAEQFLITYYGRQDLGTGCLRNRTDGGEGAANPSEELRNVRRQAMHTVNMSLTTEQRRELARKAGHASAMSLNKPTLEQRSNNGRKGAAALTTEQRREMGRRGAAALTVEQRSELGRKGAMAANAKCTAAQQEVKVRVLNTPEILARRTHTRWHVQRGILNPNCELCIPLVTSAPQQLQQALPA